MFARQSQARRLSRLLPLGCALLAGCAGLRCPRIDPTGERCFIWPKDEIVTPVAAVPSNLTAPPVGTDIVFPQPQAPAAPAAMAPAVVPASVALPPVPGDKLSITPERVLAPVGSEVVLKASICTTDGYTLADQKIEWMLGRNGVGQFVEVGGKGVFHPPLLPWNSGSKVDNYLANGYTANGPVCITRGTADPTDDININRGDAWISVTSPNEGTSHVIAYTPAVESWDQRKSAATIYWVDVQWTFPPPSVSSSGRSEMLTTVVNRQTNGTPIEGWIVRYQVADGPAQEVATGPDGRASVQVAPTASGAASSQIDMQLVRPAGYRGDDAPRLVIGSGTTVVNWASGGEPYLPPSAAQPMPTTPPLPGPATGVPIQPGPTTPQPALPAGRAQLELTVTGDPQAQVGGQSTIRLSIRNVGDGTAAGIVLADQFDAGLMFPAKPSSAKIEKAVGDLVPGATYNEDLPFQVTKAGRLCHAITVTYADGSPINKSYCITAVAAAPQREARLSVDIEGPLQREQGQTALFKITVRNTGQVPLVNIETVEEYPPAVLQPQPTDRSVEVISGTITRRIPRLEIGQSQQFEVECFCRQATRVAVRVVGGADTEPPSHRIETAAEHSLEILPPRGQPPAGTDGAAPGAGTGPLRVGVSFDNPPARVNARATTQVEVRNNSANPDRQVSVRVIFPPELTPDVTSVDGPAGVTAQLQDGVVVFSPLATLAPRELAVYRIQMNATQAGVVQVIAQALSSNVPQPVENRARLEITSRP